MFQILYLLNSIIFLIFLICKNIISYTEELILWVIYISLFILLIAIMYNFVINYLLYISFTLMEYYEVLLLLKISLLNKVFWLLNILANGKILKNLLFQLKSNLIRKLIQKKIEKDFFFCVYKHNS
jgi:hypothetical protein